MDTVFSFADEKWLKKDKTANTCSSVFVEPSVDEVLKYDLDDYKETLAALADGHVLKRLKDSIILYGTSDYWALFLSCLKSTGVIITPDSTDAVQSKSINGENLLCGYTTAEEVRNENEKQRICFEHLVDMLAADNGYSGIIIDKDTMPLVISKQLLSGLDELARYDFEYEQNEPLIISNVQSFIENNSFPSSLEELYDRITGPVPMLNVEEILACNGLLWTVPNWAKAGDIVFFMHTKTAISIITRLKTELDSSTVYSPAQKKVLYDALSRGRALHKQVGGKIYAIGQVAGAPERLDFDDSDSEHWKGKIYADINNVFVLENPVDISEFNSFILVSRQGSITGVQGSEFEQLKQIICAKNKVPEYFKAASATPIPLKEINKYNWLELANDYRRSFLLETQFRSFYVDYFLKVFADKPVLYRECRCRKPGMADSFMDNIILFNGKYLTVEVKLNIKNEVDLPGQCAKYCNNTEVYKDTGVDKPIDISKRYSDHVLIIDTLDLYLYSGREDNIVHIINLDDIKTESDVIALRRKVIDLIDSSC